ncbi:MAG: HAD family phosphatase [bacterium]|nr:HAD family phosphatase [bacterium]
MTINGVAFDMEGTIVNVEPAHHNGWLRTAAEKGVHLSIPEAIEKIPHFIGGPDKAIVEEIFSLAPEKPALTETSFNTFMARKWAHYDKLVKELDLSPRPGFLEVLDKFRRMGLRTTIGTAVELEHGLALLKYSGLSKLFLLHNIVLLTDVKNPKPAPDCFLETARRMGVGPSEQLVFEDSPRGVKSGVAAGSPVIGMPVYNNETAKDNLLKAGAVKIYTDWRQINATELLASFED